MEGFQNWAEKALNWPMYTRRYRYQKGTTSFYVTGTSTSKSGTGTTVPFFIFILFIYFCLYFFSYSFFFGTTVPIYKYTFFECPPSRIPLNAHFISCSYSAQPDLYSRN